MRMESIIQAMTISGKKKNLQVMLKSKHQKNLKSMNERLIKVVDGQGTHINM